VIESSREEHKRDLLLEALRTHGLVRMRALGTSMVPTIWPGDLVEVERCYGSIGVGDVILTVRQESFCMHRVVRHEQASDGIRITTRGDAMRCEDPEISSSQVLGKISRVHHHGEFIRLAQQQGRFERCLARIFNSISLVRRVLLRVNNRRLSKQAPQSTCFESDSLSSKVFR
jgi:signal peptidase I